MGQAMRARATRQDKPSSRLNRGDSTLVSRNVMIGSKRTSVRLEPEMWVALFDIAHRERVTIHDLASRVDDQRKPETSLTAAIRVFVMGYFRAAATEDGHRAAGHGGLIAGQAKPDLRLVAEAAA